MIHILKEKLCFSGSFVAWGLDIVPLPLSYDLHPEKKPMVYVIDKHCVLVVVS